MRNTKIVAGLFSLLLHLAVLTGAYAQPLKKSDIVGKWHLNKIEDSSMLIFDRKRPQVVIDNNFKLVREVYSNISTKDSLDMSRKFIQNHETTKLIAYRFTEDSLYFMGERVSDSGTYTFNYEQQEINATMNGGFSESIAKKNFTFYIIDKKIVMRLGDGKASQKWEFIKLKKN